MILLFLCIVRKLLDSFFNFVHLNCFVILLSDPCFLRRQEGIPQGGVQHMDGEVQRMEGSQPCSCLRARERQGKCR